jgi:hypothetical protein
MALSAGRQVNRSLNSGKKREAQVSSDDLPLLLPFAPFPEGDM